MQNEFEFDLDLEFEMEETPKTKKGSSNKDISSKARKSYLKRSQLLINRTSTALEMLPGNFKEGECLNIVSNGSFGSNNMLRAINQKFNIKKLWVTAWSFNDLFVEVIREIYPDEFRFFCDSSILSRKAHYWAKINNELKDLPDVRMETVLKLHAKVMVLETEKAGKLVYDASANFSQNFRIEQYNIYRDEELFEFHKSWMQKLLK